MPLLSARGLRKSVGTGRAARVLLDRADLELEAGEIVAILGRSGSGKSTLLNLLGGIDRAGGVAIETWMIDGAGSALADTARELSYLDAQGGRPQGNAGEPGDRNAALPLSPGFDARDLG